MVETSLEVGYACSFDPRRSDFGGQSQHLRKVLDRCVTLSSKIGTSLDMAVIKCGCKIDFHFIEKASSPLAIGQAFMFD